MGKAKDNRAEEVLAAVLRICNSGQTVSFEQDMGGNTLTIVVGDEHSHVGCPGEGFDMLLDNLHGLLTKGRGLSWVKS